MTSSNGLILWPVLAYGGIMLVIVAAIFVISYFLGERHRAPGRDKPYESGIQPTGTTHLRYDAKYYLVGVFFVLFDVEAAIINAWAVAFRELGWGGYAGASLFIVTLAIGLIYIWKLGGLDWYSAQSAKSEMTVDEYPANKQIYIRSPAVLTEFPDSQARGHDSVG